MDLDSLLKSIKVVFFYISLKMQFNMVFLTSHHVSKQCCNSIKHNHTPNSRIVSVIIQKYL